MCFGGTVFCKIYDPSLAVGMLSVLLFGQWGTYNVFRAVYKFVDETSEYKNVSEIQLWGSRLQTPSSSKGNTFVSSYIPGEDSPQHSSDMDKLEKLELIPN